MPAKAVFFDRDGIVNRRLIGDYVKNIAEFEFIPDFLETLLKVKQLGYYALLVTNQQGIGKGLLTIDDLQQIHNHMQNELKAKTGFAFDDIAFCPSLDSDNDYRRKPNPGMIWDFIHKYKLNPTQCWMIGDSVTDIIAAQKAGLHSILINESDLEVEADFVFPNLLSLNQKLTEILTNNQKS